MSERPEHVRPYAAGRPAEAVSLPWPRLLVRTFLILLPSQVVGTLLAAVLILLVGGADHPAVGWSAFVVPALVGGAALGLLLRPGAGHLGRYAAAAAVLSAVVTVALVLLSRARISEGSQPGLGSTLFPGLLITVVLETVVAVAVWVLRERRR